jgi:hypothetical protein
MSNPLIGNQSANTEQLPTPPSSPRPQVLGRVSILSVTLYAEYSYHQKSRILLERDYSLVLSREQKRNTLQRSGRESSRLERELKKDLIVKREFHPAILLFLTLYLAAGLGVPLLILSYATVSLLFDLENFLGYLHASAKITLVTSRIVPTLRRVPRFEAPIHVPRPRNPSPHPPPPYVRGPRVILEEESDESLTDSS